NRNRRTIREVIGQGESREIMRGTKFRMRWIIMRSLRKGKSSFLQLSNQLLMRGMQKVFIATTKHQLFLMPKSTYWEFSIPKRLIFISSKLHQRNKTAILNISQSTFRNFPFAISPPNKKYF